MKGIKCSCCISLVYKKCSKLKTSEITELQKSKRKHWQCISCQSHKIPYATIDAIELQKNLQFKYYMQLVDRNRLFN